MSENGQHNEPESTEFNPIPWVAGALFVLGIAILAGIYWKRTVVVKDIHFGGYHFVPLESLEQKVSIPAGIRPDSIDFMKIIREVETIDYVKQAAVNVEPSGDLFIEITERKPIALLVNGNDKVYVDEQGVRLPVFLGKSVDVPIVYGFKTKPVGDTLKSEAWNKAQAFLVEMHKSPLSNATISEIAWTRDEGIVALTHENGVKLIFGKDNFKSRLRNWKAFYSKVIREKSIQKMQLIDLRFRGQVVTRES